jgi:hypothetical protein
MQEAPSVMKEMQKLSSSQTVFTSMPLNNEIFTTSNTEQNNQFSETILFTPQLYNLLINLNEKVQKLTEENENLKKEVNRIKSITNIKFKKNILEYLNYLPPPNHSFKEWLKTFQITYDYLTIVFEGDLIDGIKKCLEDKIAKEGINSIPIKYFKEKPEYMFIYTDENLLKKSEEDQQKQPITNNSLKTCKFEWKMGLKIEFNQIIEHISYEFINIFYVWQSENEKTTVHSIEEKEKMIVYISKIMGMGSKSKQEKHRSELHKWFINRISI